MNVFLLSAAALAAVWTLVHGIVGGRQCARPLAADQQLIPVIRARATPKETAHRSSPRTRQPPITIFSPSAFASRRNTSPSCSALDSLRP